jgi:hypothetical protein
MIDLIIQAKAYLNAITVLTYIIIFLSVVALAGLALVLISRRKTFKRLGLWLMRLSGIAVILLLIFIFWPRPEPKHNLAWDLRAVHSLEQIGSPRCAEWKGESAIWRNCIWQGDIQIQMSFPEKRDFIEKAKIVWVTAADQRVESISVTTKAYSTERAFQRTRELLNQWNIDEKTLLEWHEEVKAGKAEEDSRHFYDFEDQPRVPKLNVVIKRIENKRYRKTPWFLSVEFRWKQ